MTTTLISPADQQTHDTQTSLVGGGIDFDSGQRWDDIQTASAAVENSSPQAIASSTPISGTPAGTNLPEPTNALTTPKSGSSAQDSTSSSGHCRPDAHCATAAAGSTWNGSDATSGLPTPIPGPSLSDPFLALAADVLDDAEQTRISNENRLRQLTRTGEDADGEERGFGLDETHPDVARLAALVDMLKQIEHQAGLNLNRLLRQHPLGSWVKAQKGIGEKQAARLLAVVGDPYVNEQTGEIRTVSQLWAYCGHGDPKRRKFKGMTQDDLFKLGNPTAKSRLWLIACAVLKAQGPLVSVYYDRKDATVDRLHATTCVRCGPSGKPALEGSPWSDAHRHADALRVLGKEILRQMWLEAKRIHEAA